MFADSELSKGSIGEPFLCREYEKRGFSGISFDILNATEAASELCIFAGSTKECTYHDMGRFIYVGALEP